MKVFITKWALTAGILEKDARLCSGADGTMVEVLASKVPGETHYNYYIHKPHWHENREEAVERAEKMRNAKIVSLRKQLKKLEEMRFEGKE